VGWTLWFHHTYLTFAPTTSPTQTTRTHNRSVALAAVNTGTTTAIATACTTNLAKQEATTTMWSLHYTTPHHPTPHHTTPHHTTPHHTGSSCPGFCLARGIRRHSGLLSARPLASVLRRPIPQFRPFGANARPSGPASQVRVPLFGLARRTLFIRLQWPTRAWSPSRRSS
jgi:hypothetical protein